MTLLLLYTNGLPEPHPEQADEIPDNLEDDTEIQDQLRPRDSRNFEFVNATGAMVPNATTRPRIRSHVMREANRLIYSTNTGQSVGSSSARGPLMQESSQPQVQKFRISSAGLRPMLPSKRSRRGQNRSGRSSPSRLIEDVEEYEQPPNAQQLPANRPEEPNDSRSAMGRLFSDTGSQSFYQYTGADPPSTAAQILEQGITPVILPVSSRRLIQPFVHLPTTVGGGQMYPFNSLPIPHSHRTEILLRHCESTYHPTLLVTSLKPLLQSKPRSTWNSIDEVIGK